MLLIILALSGCGIKQITNIPDGKPKGYVQFFEDSYKFQYKIYEIQGYHEEYIGKLVQKKYLLIDFEPGEHFLKLQMHGAIRKFDIEVIENQITPVLVHVKFIDSHWNVSGITTTYEVTPPEIGDPIPYILDKSHKEFIIHALNSRYYSTRIAMLLKLKEYINCMDDEIAEHLDWIIQNETNYRIKDLAISLKNEYLTDK